MQSIQLFMRPGALLQYQSIAALDDPSQTYIMFGRQVNNEFEIHQLYPFQLFNEKGKINKEGFDELQKFQLDQHLELFKVGILYVNNGLELPVDTMQLLDAYMQSYEWVPNPLQLWVSQNELRDMQVQADWVGRQSESGKKSEATKLQVKIFNCEEIVLASMLSVLE